VNNLIPPPKVLGVLSNCSCVEGDPIVGRSIEELERRAWAKSLKCWTGDGEFEDIKKHQIQRLFEVRGSGYIWVEEQG